MCMILHNIFVKHYCIAYNNNILMFRTRLLKNHIFQNKCHSDLTVSPSAQNDTKPPYYMINIISEEMKKKFCCSFRHYKTCPPPVATTHTHTHTHIYIHVINCILRVCCTILYNMFPFKLFPVPLQTIHTGLLICNIYKLRTLHICVGKVRV